jgi:putative phosphoribosyl transferase
MASPIPFAHRRAAGIELARALSRYRGSDPLIAALPRGGVPVAFEVARELDGTLDVLLVRKIGAPFQPELALGAIVDSEPQQVVWNDEIVAALLPGDAYLQRERARQTEEIIRRRKLYRGDAPPLSAANRTAIVVDDGVATGSTMKVALLALRQAGAARIVAAAPVAPREVWPSIAELADDAVCLALPDQFGAVGFYYTDFDQTSDDEVLVLLQRARDKRW